MAVSLKNYYAARVPQGNTAQRGTMSTDTITTPYKTFRQQFNDMPTYTTPDYASQSSADQLRRQEAWKAVQQGVQNPGLSQQEILAQQNAVANQYASQSSAAERAAQQQAAMRGTLGSGIEDRRAQELAMMNMAQSSAAQQGIAMQARQDALNRGLEYAGLASSTASQFGQDELSRQQLQEQAIMDRQRLSESARQANMGASVGLYQWQNEQDLANRYRQQEYDDYMNAWDDLYGDTGSRSYGRNTRGFGVL